MAKLFHTLDVFTETPLTGNPLAVVHGADDLDDTAMQAIAAEFGLSETVFLLEPRDSVNTARMRIFTPRRELPFAGHPAVGTAILIAQQRAPEMLRGSGLTVALEVAVGLLTVEVRRPAGRAIRAELDLPRLPEPRDGPIDTAALALALGLDAADIAQHPHRPSRFAAGGPSFLLVPVTGREALTRARPPAPDFPEPIFAYVPGDTMTGTPVEARMFAPCLGVTEDPATGSAVAALAGAIMAFERPGDGSVQRVVAQGHAMGRPSAIVLTMTVAGGVLTHATLGGAAVLVSEGRLLL